MAVRFISLFTLALLPLIRPTVSFTNDLRLDSLLSDATLFRDVFQLARRAASGQCHCQQQGSLNGDAFRKKKILDLAVQLEQLLLRESVTNVLKRSPTAKRPNRADYKENACEGKRVKRFPFHVRRRIAFPPGTKISMTPTFHLPFVRDMPDGLISNMTISFPFHISLDEMGLTDDDNMFGTFPVVRRIWNMIFGKRRQRSSGFHVPSRMTIYRIIENVLYNLGLAGRECLLRAICEAHEHPIDERHGLLGEALQFLLTASRDDLGTEGAEYILAERSGRELGECWHYYGQCAQSLFRFPSTHYDAEYM